MDITYLLLLLLHITGLLYCVSAVKFEVVEDEGLEPYIELPVQELMQSENLIIVDAKAKKPPQVLRVTTKGPASSTAKPASTTKKDGAATQKPNGASTTKKPVDVPKPPAGDAKAPPPPAPDHGVQPKPLGNILSPQVVARQPAVVKMEMGMKIWRQDLRLKR